MPCFLNSSALPNITDPGKQYWALYMIILVGFYQISGCFVSEESAFVPLLFIASCFKCIFRVTRYPSTKRTNCFQNSHYVKFFVIKNISGNSEFAFCLGYAEHWCLLPWIWIDSKVFFPLKTVLPGNTAAELEMAKPSEILTSTTDSEAWNIEVERVAPKLKVTVKVDGRDWRSHLEQVGI